MRFASFLRIQIHSWNANISNESCSPLHQGEEPDDTERSSGSFLFILRYLLEWWVKRRELWGGGGRGEGNRSVVNNREIDVQFLMLCSDNADCVTYFSLISRWCSFIRRLTILPVSSMYTCSQQGILYIPMELSGFWFLGFLKICPIFLGLKIVWILYLFNILPIRPVIPLIYGKMDKIFSSDCVSEIVVLFACLLIVISFLSCPFFCKTNFK